MTIPMFLDWDNDARSGDLRFGARDGVPEEWAEIYSAMILSLFSDAPAATDDALPRGDNDPRGWWADGDVKIGSRLWIHLQRPRNQATLDQLRADCLEALQWMMDDGVATSVTVVMAWRDITAVAAIDVVRNSGSHRFDFAWPA